MAGNRPPFFIVRVLSKRTGGLLPESQVNFGLHFQEPDMLQDLPTPTLREASPCELAGVGDPEGGRAADIGEEE